MSHYDEQRDNKLWVFYEIKPKIMVQRDEFNKLKRSTGDGLTDLLIRNGVTPTGLQHKDLVLAKEFMPIGYLG